MDPGNCTNVQYFYKPVWKEHTWTNEGRAVLLPFLSLCLSEWLRLAEWKYFQLLLRGQISLQCLTWTLFLQNTLNTDRNSFTEIVSQPEQLIKSNKREEKEKERTSMAPSWIMNELSVVSTWDPQFSRPCDSFRSSDMKLYTPSWLVTVCLLVSLKMQILILPHWPMLGKMWIGHSSVAIRQKSHKNSKVMILKRRDTFHDVI